MSAYWASLSLGRVVFGALATRHRPERLLRVSLALSSGASALIWWAAQPVIGLLGLAALGFAFAPIYPLLVAITPGHRHVTQAVGLQVAVAYLGTAALPCAAGALAASMGLEVIPALVVGGTVALALLHERAARAGRTASGLPATGPAGRGLRA